MGADDLVDFEVIENQKENIQSLPSGRSAKALAQLFTPPLSSSHGQTLSPSHMQDLNHNALPEKLSRPSAFLEHLQRKKHRRLGDGCQPGQRHEITCEAGYLACRRG